MKLDDDLTMELVDDLTMKLVDDSTMKLVDDKERFRTIQNRRFRVIVLNFMPSTQNMFSVVFMHSCMCIIYTTFVQSFMFSIYEKA